MQWVLPLIYFGLKVSLQLSETLVPKLSLCIKEKLFLLLLGFWGLFLALAATSSAKQKSPMLGWCVISVRTGEL